MEDVAARLARALAGRYEIERELGRGGMATVYLATDRKHDRRVAIKVLRPELAAGLGADRFVREIEIAARLSHPHILSLFDSGEADGFLYYVMPYVEGESLQERLSREGRISTAEAIRLADQVASALAYAHERGVVHRDIKPANILLAGDQAVVADFGIARAVQAAGAEGLTVTGHSIGTPAYMSPEQALGGEAVDARTDVYALGCVVYEMVSGGLPFEGTDPLALIAKRAAERAPSLRRTDPGVPLFLDRAVSKALATDPEDRFASAAAFAEALTTGTTVRRVRSRARRRRARTGVTALAVLVLAGWGLAALLGGPRMDRLAVLPLVDLTQDPDRAYLASGVQEALIAELGRLGVPVISRASTTRYRDTDQGIREIARELDVDGVIEGSVFLGGDSLEIVTRLYDREEREVWAGSFDGALPDVVGLYRGFARTIADRIRVRLSPEEEARLATADRVDPEVYEAYLRGMHALYEMHTREGGEPGSREDYDSAIAYVETAVRRNPGDALAWAGLASCYVMLGHDLMVSDPKLWTRVRAAAERAIRLDSTSAEGWAALAAFQYYWGRDWAAAEAAFRKANELNPSLAWNHYHYAWYLALFGRVEEAVAEHQRGHELDPMTPYHATWLPALHWFSRDLERAYAEARALVDGPYADDPIAVHVLAVSAARTGRVEEVQALEEKIRAFGGPEEAARRLGEAYWSAGRREDALAAWGELANGDFLVQAALGNREQALRLLEDLPEGFGVPWLLLAPELDALRDEPRFQAVARRMNLVFEPGRLAPVPLPVTQPELPAVMETG